MRNFRFEGNLGEFSLDAADPDDGDLFGNSKRFEVDPSVYAVKQIAPYRWTLSAIECVGGESTVDLANATVSISAAAGDDAERRPEARGDSAFWQRTARRGAGGCSRGRTNEPRIPYRRASRP